MEKGTLHRLLHFIIELSWRHVKAPKFIQKRAQAILSYLIRHLKPLRSRRVRCRDRLRVSGSSSRLRLPASQTPFRILRSDWPLHIQLRKDALADPRGHMLLPGRIVFSLSISAQCLNMALSVPLITLAGFIVRSERQYCQLLLLSTCIASEFCEATGLSALYKGLQATQQEL